MTKRATSILVLFIISIFPVYGQRCTKQLTHCSCTLDNGLTLDLNPLSAAGPAPLFEGKDPSPGTLYQYQWDPCRTFACLPGGGSSVSVCQTDKSLYAFDIGDQSTATFQYDSARGIYIQYTTAATNGRSSKVFLKCNPTATTPIYQVMGEVPVYSSKYEVSLTSVHVCGTTAGGDQGWSLGDVLLLIFFLMLIIYLIAGILINIFVRHQSGTAVIPQRDFWFSLPGLVKDGVSFSIGAVKGRAKPSSTYQEM